MKPIQIKNGRWKEFNKHAVLIAEGNYVNNEKHGTWREYYDHTGTLMIQEDFRNGIQHGKFVSYHPNGQVFSEGQFCNGLREGCFNVYDEQGNNVKNLIFKNDVQIDENTLALVGRINAQTFHKTLIEEKINEEKNLDR